MYSIIDTPDFRILSVELPTNKKFTTGGEIVKLDKNGLAFIPLGDVVSVNKVLHFQMSSIRSIKYRQQLHNNAGITKFELQGGTIEVDEEEILLSSLEQIENI
jgi:hypothetical protein